MPSILSDGVELRHLRYFRALAEAGSFTRAASAIGLKQPTLSHQIRQLETALGTELFQRGGRNACRLTAAGGLLLPHVQRVLGEMEALRQALDDQSGLQRGSLTIAVLPVLVERVLARALSVFRHAHPGVQVRVLEMSVDAMEEALAVGSVDLCIASTDTHERARKARLLFEEELVAVVPPDFICAGGASVTVAELAGLPVIVPPPGFGTRTLILNAWAKVRRSPTFSLETNSTKLVLQAVATSGAVGILPASALWGRQPVGWVAVRITRPALRRSVGVYHAQVGNCRPAAEALMPLLRQAVADCLAESVGPAGAVTLLAGNHGA